MGQFLYFPPENFGFLVGEAIERQLKGADQMPPFENRRQDPLV